MSSRDYLPTGEGDRIAWLINFKTQLQASGATFGFAAPEITAAVAVIDAAIALHAAHVTAQEAARSACRAKDDGLETALRNVRGDVARLQAAPSMTDAVRRLYGITVRDDIATAASVRHPATRPQLNISVARLQRHVITFTDEANPTRRAKPAGIHHIDLFYKKGGAAPASDAEWIFLASDTATPYTNEFDLADIGVTVYYRGRWVSTRGEPGEWSAMAQAKVPG